MTKTELADSLTNSLFADRDTIQEAVDYALMVFRKVGEKEDQIYLTTGLLVVMNTIARAVRNLEGGD